MVSSGKVIDVWKRMILIILITPYIHIYKNKQTRLRVLIVLRSGSSKTNLFSYIHIYRSHGMHMSRMGDTNLDYGSNECTFRWLQVYSDLSLK